MKEEIAKILTMVQEEKITAEKGAELIELLKEETPSHSSSQTSYLKKMLRIRINSGEGDKVNINLPVNLVKTILTAGRHIAEQFPESEKYVKDIDMDLLLNAIESEAEGQIVDITSANNDTVLIVIE
ncbi:hypothetical protein SAMN05444392_11313 [Seinonella peptonophila]|uniref:YvlB/LiaX N-terminal domain-containing protein n=1 Tax=Seinonella peptonophila TaxID=112248 RepID=A0A1M5ABV6_9BACL|nr:hypothetical protein [Seinonella peptonophila]SHF27624.1 hypothetical protein SAMN05444392_11313 [Seinonella peptonophila]